MPIPLDRGLPAHDPGTSGVKYSLLPSHQVAECGLRRVTPVDVVTLSKLIADLGDSSVMDRAWS
jgi:hypothetical protein